MKPSQRVEQLIEEKVKAWPQDAMYPRPYALYFRLNAIVQVMDELAEKEGSK